MIAANVNGSAAPGQKPPPESSSPDGVGVFVVPGPGSPASPVSTKPDAVVIPPQHHAEQRRQTEHGQHLPGQAGRFGEGDACEPGDGEVDESHRAVLRAKRFCPLARPQYSATLRGGQLLITHLLVYSPTQGCLKEIQRCARILMDFGGFAQDVLSTDFWNELNG